MLKLKKLFDRPEVSVTITNETYFRLAGLTVFTIILLYATRKAAHALLLIFIAFFLTIALNGPVYWLSRHLPGKRKGSRQLATIISYLVIVLALGGFIASIAPPLVKQTNNFVKAAPHIVKDFRNQDSSTGRLIRKYHLEKQVDSFSAQLSQRLKHAGGSAFSAAQKIGSSAFALLTILVLTFMMLIEGPAWLGFMRDVVPDKHHKNFDRLSHEMYKVVAGFANGQVTLAALAAALIMPAILILHISYPIALMVIVFICGLIPMVGHTIGAVIVTAVALFHSMPAAVIILAYYITYQQIENYLIQPKIQANSTNMSPLLVFASVIIGVSFGGLFGGLFAIPVAGCIRILVLEYLRSEKIIDAAEVDQLTTEPR